ncbi:uncharacterized protein BXZ73DRAFT_1626, partial [Epithele typhae]|uniref:uncharacterized protein n=1 Tax=Epithele typhae TaxID=378194 RepID=UPI00200823F8
IQRKSEKQHTEEEISKAREENARTVEKYSDELVDQLNREIDGLLTFAGLFSAIMSAFNVVSYTLLQPPPSDDNNALFARVPIQRQSTSLGLPAFTPASWTIWVNSLWFPSLILSLSSATIGIMIKQWIKEYNTGLYGSSSDIARRRQYRLNNLDRSRITVIFTLVPLLLLIAVALFIAGLLVLLFHTNAVVFAATAAFSGVLLAFIIGTTVVPSFLPSCCYFSPQARAFFFIWKTVLLT